jgi:hypothetical protein
MSLINDLVAGYDRLVVNGFPVKSPYVQEKNYNFVLNIDSSTGSYLFIKDKGKFGCLVTPSKRTSGIAPYLGSDQIKYVIPGFNEEAFNAWSDCIMAASNSLPHLNLGTIVNVVKEIGDIYQGIKEAVTINEQDMKDLLIKASLDKKATTMPMISILLDGKNLCDFPALVSYWSNLCSSGSKPNNVSENCSCCLSTTNPIPKKLPSPLNELFSSNDKCFHQYGNTTSNICVSCAEKANSFLLSIDVTHLGKKALVYFERASYTSINDHKLYVSNLGHKKLRSQKPHNLVSFLYVIPKMGRSIYMKEIDYISHIDSFFAKQYQHISNTYYSVRDLSYFFIVEQDKHMMEYAEENLLNYMINGVMTGKTLMVKYLLNVLVRKIVSGKKINNEVVNILFEYLTTKEESTMEKRQEAVYTLGRSVSDLQTQHFGAGKSEYSSPFRKYYRDFTKNPSKAWTKVMDNLIPSGVYLSSYLKEDCSVEEKLVELPETPMSVNDIKWFLAGYGYERDRRKDSRLVAEDVEGENEEESLTVRC